MKKGLIAALAAGVLILTVLVCTAPASGTRPVRHLGQKEWKVTGNIVTGFAILIHKCQLPSDANKVGVGMNVRYTNGQTKSFYDTVDIKGGKADHATLVGKKSVNQTATQVYVNYGKK